MRPAVSPTVPLEPRPPRETGLGPLPGDTPRAGGGHGPYFAEGGLRRPPAVTRAPRSYHSTMAPASCPSSARVPAVLVVDDEPGVASFVARGLRARGYDVDTASGGQEALLKVGRRDYDVVLLDLRMPETSGVAVLRQITTRRPGVKVVVVSAAADTQIKVRCLELGATDFVAKPFELAELVARVGAHTRAVPAVEPAAPRVLRAGRIALDLDRSTVDAGAGPQPLSAREFRLLLHLVRRAGEPCPREELLREAWDTTFDTGTNVVDVCVHRLRQKLGTEAIETVRNVGYRLVV